jgi:hypothetical protein
MGECQNYRMSGSQAQIKAQGSRTQSQNLSRQNVSFKDISSVGQSSKTERQRNSDRTAGANAGRTERQGQTPAGRGKRRQAGANAGRTERQGQTPAGQNGRGRNGRLLRLAPPAGSSGWLLRLAPPAGSSGYPAGRYPGRVSYGWLLRLPGRALPRPGLLRLALLLRLLDLLEAFGRDV